MKPGVITKKPKKIFYGWYVVATSTIISAVGGGLHFYGFTALVLERYHYHRPHMGLGMRTPLRREDECRISTEN